MSFDDQESKGRRIETLLEIEINYTMATPHQKLQHSTVQFYAQMPAIVGTPFISVSGHDSATDVEVMTAHTNRHSQMRESVEP